MISPVNKSSVESRLSEELASLTSYTRLDKEFGFIIKLSKDLEEFDIYIEGSYPSNPPKVFEVFHRRSPQGSDILESILGRKWTPDTKLIDIYSALPGNPSAIFHLGHTFPLYLFNSSQLFTCTALDPISNKPHQSIKLVISSTHIFQIQLFNEISGHLIAYASLKSVKNLKTSASDHNRFTIVWRGCVEAYQVFKSNEAELVIQTILGNLQKIGVRCNKVNVVRNMINEDEVTPESLKKVKIHEIEAEIIETELDLERELQKVKINTLISLYQKAIEYYSALGDERFDAYLMKIKNLLGNSEILSVMSQENEVVVNSTSDIVRAIEEEEIWPANKDQESS